MHLVSYIVSFTTPRKRSSCPRRACPSPRCWASAFQGTLLSQVNMMSSCLRSKLSDLSFESLRFPKCLDILQRWLVAPSVASSAGFRFVVPFQNTVLHYHAQLKSVRLRWLLLTVLTIFGTSKWRCSKPCYKSYQIVLKYCMWNVLKILHPKKCSACLVIGYDSHCF